MTKKELEQVNMINVHLRDEKSVPMKESFGIAMLIVENKEFISSVISPEIIRCRDCQWSEDFCPWDDKRNGFCHKAVKKKKHRRG